MQRRINNNTCSSTDSSRCTRTAWRAWPSRSCAPCQTSKVSTSPAMLCVAMRTWVRPCSGWPTTMSPPASLCALWVASGATSTTTEHRPARLTPTTAAPPSASGPTSRRSSATPGKAAHQPDPRPRSPRRNPDSRPEHRPPMLLKSPLKLLCRRCLDRSSSLISVTIAVITAIRWVEIDIILEVELVVFHYLEFRVAAPMKNYFIVQEFG